MMRLREYPFIYPNTSMEPEWDCLAQIQATTQALTMMAPTIDHVKGHQDATTQYKELPLLAQLNCDADTYAKLYLCDNPNINHTIVHLFPTRECLLQLNSGTITRDIKHACTEARNLPPLQKHITKINKWPRGDVFNLVDWNAHGHALQQQEKYRPTFVKYLHKIIPIVKQIHPYNPKYPPNCPTCNHENKDMQHFWGCQAHSRLQWCRQFLKDLQKKLIGLGTGTHIRDLLMAKLWAVLDGDNPDGVPEAALVSALCEQQRQVK